MGIRSKDFDVTKSIKIVETLKSDLLANVSDLYKYLAEGKNDPTEKDDIFADIIISAYLLSNRLNTNPKTLNKKMTDKLKLKVLNNDDELYSDYSILLKSLGVTNNHDRIE